MQRGQLLRAAYLIGTAALLWALFSHWAYDDPFITYRYAQNIASGRGFVYNPGERVLSTTTPLFTLLLAVGSGLNLDLPTLSNLIGVLSIAISALLLFELSRDWGAPAAGWAALLIYPTLPLVLTPLGLEMPFYIALCLGALLAHSRQRPLWAGTLAALATLTRNDGVLIVLVIAAHLLWQWHGHKHAHPAQSRIHIQHWLGRFVPVYLLIVGVWFIFATWYFGAPWPVTLATKHAQAQLAGSSAFATAWPQLLRDYFSAGRYGLAGILAGIGLVWSLVRKRAAWLLLGWMAVYAAAYSLLGVSNYFWYYAPLMTGAVVLMGLGLDAILQALSQVVPLRARTLLGFVGMLIIAIPFLARLPEVPTRFADRRPALYTAVGTWLRQNTPPSASVAMLEVGIIGYHAQRPIIDFAGLIQPEVVTRMQPGSTYQDLAAWSVAHYQPDYIVLYQDFAPALEQGYIAQHCTLARRFAAQDHNATVGVNVFACR